MKKPAPVDHPVHELIVERWSPRSFADRHIELEILKSLLEAARWAPSSYNEQPWFFIVATRNQPDEFKQLLNCLTPGNQLWAQHAAALMVTVTKLVFDKTSKSNRHAYHDIGLAAAQLTIQATALGLAVHQMAGIEVTKIRQTYEIPEEYDPVTGIAIGYHSDADTLPNDLRERELAPRQRKPLKSFVFTRKWGNRLF